MRKVKVGKGSGLSEVTWLANSKDGTLSMLAPETLPLSPTQSCPSLDTEGQGARGQGGKNRSKPEGKEQSLQRWGLPGQGVEKNHSHRFAQLLVYF